MVNTQVWWWIKTSMKRNSNSADESQTYFLKPSRFHHWNQFTKPNNSQTLSLDAVNASIFTSQTYAQTLFRKRRWWTVLHAHIWAKNTLSLCQHRVILPDYCIALHTYSCMYGSHLLERTMYNVIEMIFFVWLLLSK